MYNITFNDYGLCYVVPNDWPLWQAYRLGTQRKNRVKFKTYKSAARALKQVYFWKYGKKLKTPINQLQDWNIIKDDEDIS